MVFDNHDARIRYYELLLQRDTLCDIPEYELPKGYRFVYYQDGDLEDWIAIEQSAKEFDSREEGHSAWGRFYAGREEELSSRMVLSRIWRGRKWQPHFMMSAAGILPVPDGCTGWQCAGNIRGLGSQNP